MAVFSCKVVVKAPLAAANQADQDDNQSSWHALRNMSGLNTSFLNHVAMVSRHVRTVYDTRRVCSLCPKISSLSGRNVMMSPSFMAAVKWNGVG